MGEFTPVSSVHPATERGHITPRLVTSNHGATAPQEGEGREGTSSPGTCVIRACSMFGTRHSIPCTCMQPLCHLPCLTSFFSPSLSLSFPGGLQGLRPRGHPIFPEPRHFDVETDRVFPTKHFCEHGMPMQPLNHVPCAEFCTNCQTSWHVHTQVCCEWKTEA